MITIQIESDDKPPALDKLIRRIAVTLISKDITLALELFKLSCDVYNEAYHAGMEEGAASERMYPRRD